MADYSDILRFLKGVSSVESDDNPEAQHMPASVGVNKGQSAVGQYGVMPGTAIQMAKESAENSPADELFKGANPEQASQLMKENPQFQKLFAEKLANKILDKSNDDTNDAYYKWRWGQNKPDASIDAIQAATPALQAKVEDRMNAVPEMSQMDQLTAQRPAPQMFNSPDVNPMAKVRFSHLRNTVRMRKP